MNEEKLCPFKKGTVKRWAPNLENNCEPNQYDILMPCDGERCMAYNGGECRKFPADSKKPKKEATNEEKEKGQDDEGNTPGEL